MALAYHGILDADQLERAGHALTLMSGRKALPWDAGHVLFMLLLRANEELCANPSISVMAREINRSTSYVKAGLRWLEAAGHVTVHRGLGVFAAERGGRQQVDRGTGCANAYRIHLPEPVRWAIYDFPPEEWEAIKAETAPEMGAL